MQKVFGYVNNAPHRLQKTFGIKLGMFWKFFIIMRYFIITQLYSKSVHQSSSPYFGFVSKFIVRKSVNLYSMIVLAGEYLTFYIFAF